MTVPDINQVVDKLAEKIGVAAEKLLPIATETIRQVSLRGYTVAVCLAVLSLVTLSGCVLCAHLHIKMRTEPHSCYEGGWLAVTILSGIATLALLCTAIVFLAQGVAPLPSLLGR